MKLSTLSRSAKSIREVTPLFHDLARLVGQFLGTELPYNPGDLFVREYYPRKKQYKRRPQIGRSPLPPRLNTFLG